METIAKLVEFADKAEMAEDKAVACSGLRLRVKGV